MSDEIFSRKTVNSVHSKLKHALFGVLTGLVISLPMNASAAVIKDFKASFEVDAFDIKLGTSQQTFRCEQQNCTLTATASPSGIASWFLHEETEEIIHLQQTESGFAWQSYQKITRSTSEKGKILKTVNFVKTDSMPVRVNYIEKERFWPIKPKLYDMVSIAYALQYAKLNKQPLNGFHLQDTNLQEAVDISDSNPIESLELADLETTVDAERFEFETSKAKIKVWLLPSYDYFPGRIDVYNIEKDKTITLLLEELPETL